MKEMRQDPISGRWVVISTDRAARPYDFKRPEPAAEAKGCPFCGGDGPRVMAHPAPLHLDGAVSEMIVESSTHVRSLDRLAQAEIERVLEMWEKRMRLHASNPGLAYGALLKNQGFGDRFGRNMYHHVHSEFTGLPIVPKRAEFELKAAVSHFEKKHSCLFCELAADERRDGARVVAENAAFTAFCPYASHVPHEIRILPIKHSARFALSSKERGDLAALLKDLLARLRSGLADRPYYLILHEAPFRAARAEESCHWRLEITPWSAYAAGFEWGSGIYINPVEPEEAARKLREASHGS